MDRNRNRSLENKPIATYVMAQRLGNWEMQRAATKRLMWNPPSQTAIATRLHSFTNPSCATLKAIASIQQRTVPWHLEHERLVLPPIDRGIDRNTLRDERRVQRGAWIAAFEIVGVASIKGSIGKHTQGWEKGLKRCLDCSVWNCWCCMLTWWSLFPPLGALLRATEIGCLAIPYRVLWSIGITMWGRFANLEFSVGSLCGLFQDTFLISKCFHPYRWAALETVKHSFNARCKIFRILTSFETFNRRI